MPRKRNYKAEYKARKRKAQRSGYKSVKEYAAVRKSLALPARSSPIPKRILETQKPGYVDSIIPSALGRMRAECEIWSTTHSQINRSEYKPSFTPEQVRQYHKAYVEYPAGLSRRKGAKEKKKRIGAYVKKWHKVKEDEWKQKYVLQGV